jgi:predicted DNA-binding transcriptional regulator AlpA
LSALVVALSARRCALGALALNAAAKRQLQCPAEEPEHNLSAKEAAARLGVSTAYLYKNAGRFPFALRTGRRLLFSSRGLERWNRTRTGAA